MESAARAEVITDVHERPPAIDRTMQAITQEKYGSPDVLQFKQIAIPSIADNEVLLRVRAAGVDRGTCHLMLGLPYLLRIMGFGFRKPKNQVPGLDAAGTVVAVGAAVTRFGVGDEVFGIGRGSFAPYAAARADKLARKPRNLSFEQAAVVPVSAITAMQALRDAGRVQRGQHVLIIGASGGVGTFAVQLGKAFGAVVTGVCSPEKLDFVRGLGADHVIDYSCQDFADGTPAYDLILDIGGNAPLSRLRRALTRTGTLVIVGGEAGDKVTGGMGRQLRALATSPFVRQRLAMHVTKEHYADLELLTALIESGKVTPKVDQSFALDCVPEAVRYLQSGRVRGKVAITI